MHRRGEAHTIALIIREEPPVWSVQVAAPPDGSVEVRTRPALSAAMQNLAVGQAMAVIQCPTSTSALRQLAAMLGVRVLRRSPPPSLATQRADAQAMASSWLVVPNGATSPSVVGALQPRLERVPSDACRGLETLAEDAVVPATSAVATVTAMTARRSVLLAALVACTWPCFLRAPTRSQDHDQCRDWSDSVARLTL